jgi:hypothetical protein
MKSNIHLYNLKAILDIHFWCTKISSTPIESILTYPKVKPNIHLYNLKANPNIHFYCTKINYTPIESILTHPKVKPNIHLYNLKANLNNTTIKIKISCQFFEVKQS